MAFTKQEHDEIIKSIVDVTTASPEVIEMVEKIRADYDERIGMVDKDKGGEEWKEKYEELKKKYVDRFFTSPAEVDEKVKDLKEETEEHVKKDGEEVSFEDLFEKREG